MGETDREKQRGVRKDQARLAWGTGFRIEGLGPGAQDLGFKVSGLGASGFGFKAGRWPPRGGLLGCNGSCVYLTCPLDPYLTPECHEISAMA